MVNHGLEMELEFERLVEKTHGIGPTKYELFRREEDLLGLIREIVLSPQTVHPTRELTRADIEKSLKELREDCLPYFPKKDDNGK